VTLNPKSGLGHLTRCIIIAKELKKKVEIYFAIDKKNKVALQILKINKIKYFFIKKHDDISNIFEDFPILTKTIIVDLSDRFYVQNPSKLDKYFNQIKSKKIKLVVIDGLFDDTINSENYPVFDLLIQPYLETDLNKKYKALKILRGQRYVLLNSQYKLRKNIFYEKNMIAKSILICFGGSDPTLLTSYFTSFFIENFEFLKKQYFTIILGPYMKENQKNKIITKLKNYNNVLIKTNISNIKPFLLKNDIFVMASGALSRYEAAACGIPGLIIGLHKDHDIQCKLYEEFGCALYLGEQNNLTNSYFLKNIISLINNYEFRLRMHKKGIELIDGQGSIRIANEILELGT